MSLFLVPLAELHQHDRHLPAGGAHPRGQGARPGAAEDPLHHAPVHDLIRPSADLLRVGVVQQEIPAAGKALAQALGVAVQDGRELLPGHGVIRPKAAIGSFVCSSVDLIPVIIAFQRWIIIC